MFGKGILALTCFHCQPVEFITFTCVGVTPCHHENTQAASAAEMFHSQDFYSLLHEMGWKTWITCPFQRKKTFTHVRTEKLMWVFFHHWSCRTCSLSKSWLLSIRWFFSSGSAWQLQVDVNASPFVTLCCVKHHLPPRQRRHKSHQTSAGQFLFFMSCIGGLLWHHQRRTSDLQQKIRRRFSDVIPKTRNFKHSSTSRR